MTVIVSAGLNPEGQQSSRRSVLAWTVGAMALFSVGSVGWMLLDSMNPAADARAPLSVDLGGIPVGHRETVIVRDVPIFIVHRTAEEIAAARADDGADMPYPENDADRVVRDEWLVVVGIDTFRGWYLLSGQDADEDRGDWDGWRVTSEGIQYDTSGRLREGFAYGNLVIPSYAFASDTRIEFDWPGLRMEELRR